MRVAAWYRPGDVGSFVGNSFFGVGGAGVNFGRVFGVSGEFMYYDLGIRPYVRETQGLQSTSGSLQSFSLNGIVARLILLASLAATEFLALVSMTGGFRAVRGRSLVGPFSSLPGFGGIFIASMFKVSAACRHRLHTNSRVVFEIAGGYNWGGGVTYPLGRWHHAKLYGEFRYHKAYQSDVQTVVWPLTIGLRW